MSRKKRLGQQRGRHHVVNRGIDHRSVFRIDEDRVDFGQLVAEAHERTGVFVNAYCLMDNHFHLVLDCPDGGLSSFMHHLAGQFARRWHLRHGGDGPVFRGRFASRPILDEQYLVSAVRYVHRNPLAFLPADELLRYRWSSLRAYAGFRRAPTWLRCDPVRDWSGGTSALLESTIGGRHGSRPSVDANELRAAISLVLEASGVGGQFARSTTVIALLAAEMLDPPDVATLIDELVPSSPEAADQARRRARRCAVELPALRVLAAAALELLGARSSSSGARSEVNVGVHLGPGTR